MQIRFQQSDLSTLETHPLTPGLTLSETQYVSVTAEAVAGATAGAAEGSTTITTHTATPQSTLLTRTNTSTFLTETSSSSTSNVLPSSQVEFSDTGLASQDSLHPGLIAVVILAVIATIFAAILIIWTMKRSGGLLWNRFHTERRSGAVQVGLGAWIGRGPISTEGHSRDRLPGRMQTTEGIQLDDGLNSPNGILDFEKSLGTRQNPAELEANEAHWPSQRLSQRASWVSRMLSRVAHSSVSTRSSSRSRWTQRSLAHTGNWETVVQEKSSRTDENAGGLATIGMTDSRPITTSSYESDGGKYDGKAFGSFGAYLDLPPKVRTFDRLSQGTFGRVIVRRRSFDSPIPGGNS